jgi:hypothetical protein
MSNKKGGTSLSVILTDKQLNQLIQILENEGNQISNERSFTVNLNNLKDFKQSKVPVLTAFEYLSTH